MVTFLSLFSVAQLVGTAPTAAVQGFSETRMTNRHRPVASIFHNNEVGDGTIALVRTSCITARRDGYSGPLLRTSIGGTLNRLLAT